MSSLVLPGARSGATREYDFVCSVGPNCRAAWNTQDYFGDFTRRPFDAWITPFWSTVELLKLRDAPVLKPEDFMRLSLPQGDTIYNTRLNVFFHHDFSNGPDGLKPSDWRDEIPFVIEKYRYLFARFWKDLMASRAPLLVLGGVITFRDAPELSDNAMSPPEFDAGAQPYAKAASIIRDLFCDKSVSVMMVFPGSIEQPEEGDGEFLYVGIDDGSRPDYLTHDAWQHPTNVFREGFRRFGMSFRDEEKVLTVIETDSILQAQPYRLIRAGALFEKATALLDGDAGDFDRGRKYLVAAFQLGHGGPLGDDVEAVARRFGIDLVESSYSPSVVELSVVT